jgi:hypothetical protein
VKTLVPANNASARAVAKRIPPRSVIAAIGNSSEQQERKSQCYVRQQRIKPQSHESRQRQCQRLAPDDGYPKATPHGRAGATLAPADEPDVHAGRAYGAQRQTQRAVDQPDAKARERRTTLYAPLSCTIFVYFFRKRS